MIKFPDNLTEHLLGAAGVVGAVTLVICTLALGWYVVWCTSLRDLPIAQEMMGKRRQSKAQKDQIAREIREIKRHHSRRGPSLELVRQTSLSRQVPNELPQKSVIISKGCRSQEADTSRTYCCRLLFPDRFMGGRQQVVQPPRAPTDVERVYR